MPSAPQRQGWGGELWRKSRAVASAADQKPPLKVIHKNPESETITSFYLVPEDGNPLDPFLPGQFLVGRDYDDQGYVDATVVAQLFDGLPEQGMSRSMKPSPWIASEPR